MTRLSGERARPPPPGGCVPGFTLTELMIASVVGLMILAVTYEAFIAGSRGMVRAESKLGYLSDANIAFLVLRRDLHTCLSFPVRIGDNGLRIARTHTSAPSFRLTTQVVVYRWEEGPPGPALVRRVESGDPGVDGPERRMCAGALAGFKVGPAAVAGSMALLVRLTFQAPHDNAPTVFERLLVPQRMLVDRTWRPVR